jgi:hypothetical protein
VTAGASRRTASPAAKWSTTRVQAGAVPRQGRPPPGPAPATSPRWVPETARRYNGGRAQWSRKDQRPHPPPGPPPRLSPSRRGHEGPGGPAGPPPDGGLWTGPNAQGPGGAGAGDAALRVSPASTGFRPRPGVCLAALPLPPSPEGSRWEAQGKAFKKPASSRSRRRGLRRGGGRGFWRTTSTAQGPGRCTGGCGPRAGGERSLAVGAHAASRWARTACTFRWYRSSGESLRLTGGRGWTRRSRSWASPGSLRAWPGAGEAAWAVLELGQEGAHGPGSGGGLAGGGLPPAR